MVIKTERQHPAIQHRHIPESECINHNGYNIVIWNGRLCNVREPNRRLQQQMSASFVLRLLTKKPQPMAHSTGSEGAGAAAAV